MAEPITQAGAPMSRARYQKLLARRIDAGHKYALLASHRRHAQAAAAAETVADLDARLAESGLLTAADRDVLDHEDDVMWHEPPEEDLRRPCRLCSRMRRTGEVLPV